MQILKDDVKQRIMDAATLEFYHNGYRLASLRTIASNANITVGNIYAYFKNKEHLLEVIVEPALQDIRRIITNLSKGADINAISLEALSHEVVVIFFTYQLPFLILMEKCQGTKYENTKLQTIAQISERIDQEVLPYFPQEAQDPILAGAIATALMEGMLTIFASVQLDQQRIQRLVASFLLMLCHDINQMGQKKN